MPTLNRFPLLALWAKEAARRIGYTVAESEALGHAYAVLYAIRAAGQPHKKEARKPAALRRGPARPWRARRRPREVHPGAGAAPPGRASPATSSNLGYLSPERGATAPPGRGSITTRPPRGLGELGLPT